MLTDPKKVKARDARIYAALLDVYTQAQAALERATLEALASGQTGTAAYRTAQGRAITASLAEVQAHAVPIAAQGVVDAVAAARDEVRAATGAARTVEFSGVHRAAIEILVENTTEKLNGMAVTVGRRLNDIFRDAGLRFVTQGVAEGATRRDVAARMTADLAARGARFVDRAGREWQLGRYAEMVARTTTREAHTAGVIATLTDLGYDLVTISSHTHEEDVCSDFDGRTYSLSGSSDEFPILDERPPFHPNCAHVLTPGPAA